MSHLFYRKVSQIKKGSAIIYALVLIMVAAAIFTGIISFVISQVRYSLSAEPKKSALQIAEAGAFFYRWHLAHEVDGKTATEVDTYWALANDPLGVDDNGDGDCDDADTVDGDGGGTEWYESDYEGVGKYRICVIRPATGTTIATVYAEGWAYDHEEKTRAIEMRVRRPSWSEFAILSNAPLDLENGAGDSVDIDGKVHANDGIRFDENGVARNTVSSSVLTYDYGGSTKDGVWTSAADPNAVFLGGASFPVPEQDFESVRVTFDIMKDNADADYNPGKEMHITFTTNTTTSDDDGQAIVCEIKNQNTTSKKITKHKANSCDTIDLEDTTVFYIRQRAYVDGILETGKKVVIATTHQGNGSKKDSIYINGDLIHEDPTSGSVLGLAAKYGVYIVEDPLSSPSVAGGGDLSIGSHSLNGDLDVHAAILSDAGPFARDIDNEMNSMNGDLNVFGALATNEGLILNGIDDFNMIYDQRLVNTPPPYFPTGSTYLIDQWKEVEPW